MAVKIVQGCLNVYTSKADMYGNRYSGFIYKDFVTEREVKGFCGNCSESNLTGMRFVLENEQGEVVCHVHEMPIRQFNRFVKGWDYQTSQAEELAVIIRGKLARKEAE